MNNIINLDLLSSPWNWVIVFLILYFLAILTQWISVELNAAGINLFG